MLMGKGKDGESSQKEVSKGVNLKENTEGNMQTVFKEDDLVKGESHENRLKRSEASCFEQKDEGQNGKHIGVRLDTLNRKKKAKRERREGNRARSNKLLILLHDYFLLEYLGL